MRAPSLRQLEALMAVIEGGTVSRAAEIMRISQPAASKLIRDLEADTGLELFERESGRLVPTGRGMRLYEEVQRIFGGVHQLTRAVEAIRREERGHLVIGAMPALSGMFLSRVLAGFLARFPDVFVSIESRSSQFLNDAVLLRRLDAALVINSHEHPSILVEHLKAPPMVVIMPHNHPLSEKSEINPNDLKDEPFISLAESSRTHHLVDAAFRSYNLEPRIVIQSTTMQNVGELVAAGMGISIADPLSLEFVAGRVTARPFKPTQICNYHIIRPARARNSSLVSAFVEEVHTAALKTQMIV
ncbi:LysR substrate-binding domain-containing protein [Thalassospira marina]|uniref:Transcriptional regulator n=1 Tax=Thalassospira marina TaxID=2048283 RepID=A0A2N3KT83_9PROT|nr:LysR substrate-binding domain-containing protein [Thalassospira marina]PKR53755.1 transcriptional regulator [Thalassospira marina]